MKQQSLCAAVLSAMVTALLVWMTLPAFAGSPGGALSQNEGPHIIAVGTASFDRPRTFDNQAAVHVKLAAEVASKLGEDYIVLLTPRLPEGGYPYLTPFWKKNSDSFDIIPVDTSLAPPNFVEYSGKNKTHLIDWLVIKK